eukprot:UN11876
MPLQDIDNEENALVNDAEQRSREEPLSAESLKGGNRRSSFSTKPEYPENGSKTLLLCPATCLQQNLRRRSCGDRYHLDLAP